MAQFIESAFMCDGRGSCLGRTRNHRGYDEATKHKKIDTNFAALVNFQPTQHASARHPQKQGTNYYAGGTER